MPPPPLFQYLPGGEQFSGDPVAVVGVDFPSGFAVQYLYDPASNTWKRSMAGVPFVDATGTQVAPTNVIVQFVNCCVDGFEGARYQTVGSGEAWIFSAGQLVKGTWQRSDRSQVTQFVDGAGQPIRLTPGRTWVEFAPVGTPVSILPGAAPATTTTVATTPPTSTKRRQR